MPKSSPKSSLWRGLRELFGAIATPTTSSRTRTRSLMIYGVTALLGAAGAAALMLGTGSATGTANRAEIEGIVREYILSHPEIIPEAIEKLQQKRTAASVDKNRAALTTPFAGAWEGAKDADVTLVEFFDYNCGFCRASLNDIDRLLAEDKKLRIVYRELPILSDGSAEAARISLYAAEQGHYPAFHRAMYATGRADSANALVAAGRVGLDKKAAQAAAENPAYTAEVESNVRMAQALQATGTPTWVVGDSVLTGAVGYDQLKAAIAKARGK